jgi:hypothetical protein
MLKSFKAPVTLPAIVSTHFEPHAANQFTLIGGSRVTHQQYVAHHVRFLNTAIGKFRGIPHKRPLEMAIQNLWLCQDDFFHLKNIVEKLFHSQLINKEESDGVFAILTEVFCQIFPNQSADFI